MTKLNDTQLVLLTVASQRDDGNLLPVPETLTSKPEQIRKSLQDLVKKDLITEVEIGSPAAAFREEDDRRIGVFINDAGRAAIGLANAAPPAGQAAEGRTEEPSAPRARSGTKQALLLELIQREEGAAIDDIVEATGWLAHTARAAIAGLRKRGHVIELHKNEGGSRYRCQAVAQ